MIFHVIDKETGELIEARGFWAVTEGGGLIDVEDGWGCEGGGGSSVGPRNALVVLGPAPVVAVELPRVPQAWEKAFKCEVCGKKFGSSLGLLTHRQAKEHW